MRGTPGNTYRHNAPGQADGQLAPHPLCLAMGQTDKSRQSVYRGLFRSHLDEEAIDDIRLALNQPQPLGNSRFHAQIERKTGEQRAANPRGPRELEEANNLRFHIRYILRKI